MLRKMKMERICRIEVLKSSDMTDPTTLNIRPKAMVPTGTITGWNKRITLSPSI